MNTAAEHNVPKASRIGRFTFALFGWWFRQLFFGILNKEQTPGQR
jgi:hypothetical protein